MASFLAGMIIVLIILTITIICLCKTRVHNEQITKIFISVPITGMESSARTRLEQAVDYIENYIEYLGGVYDFVYDTDLDKCNDNGEYEGLQDDVSYDEQLNNDIELMKSCDVVIMTPGWENSTGCKKEFDIANEMKKQIFIINDYSNEY